MCQEFKCSIKTLLSGGMWFPNGFLLYRKSTGNNVTVEFHVQKIEPSNKLTLTACHMVMCAVEWNYCPVIRIKLNSYSNASVFYRFAACLFHFAHAHFSLRGRKMKTRIRESDEKTLALLVWIQLNETVMYGKFWLPCLLAYFRCSGIVEPKLLQSFSWKWTNMRIRSYLLCK